MITCGGPLEIGKIYTEYLISDGNGEYHHAPFLVVREATHEEWVEMNHEHGVMNPVRRPGSTHFYLISID